MRKKKLVFGSTNDEIFAYVELLQERLDVHYNLISDLRKIITTQNNDLYILRHDYNKKEKRNTVKRKNRFNSSARR